MTKSDETREKLFAAIEALVPNQLQQNVIKGLALFYAYHARIEGFDKASEIAGITPELEASASYTPLAVQMIDSRLEQVRKGTL